MADQYSMPQTLPPRSGTTPVTTNGAVATDYVKLTDSNRVWALCKLTQAVGHATVLSVFQATTAAGAGAKALVKVAKIWLVTDTATVDTWVRQTDAVALTVAADIKNKMVLFQIEPQMLDVANSFDWIKITASDSSQATNFIDVTFIMDKKTRQATPPTDIA